MQRLSFRVMIVNECKVIGMFEDYVNVSLASARRSLVAISLYDLLSI
jgi:hypothetical protein